MTLRKVVRENDEPFQFPTESRFPIGTGDRSIFLAAGRHGAGKTSIMEALTCCPYRGKADKISRSVNDPEPRGDFGLPATALTNGRKK